MIQPQAVTCLIELTSHSSLWGHISWMSVWVVSGFISGHLVLSACEEMRMRSTYRYRERDYTFGNLCVTLRTAIGVTQGNSPDCSG